MWQYDGTQSANFDKKYWEINQGMSHTSCPTVFVQIWVCIIILIK